MKSFALRCHDRFVVKQFKYVQVYMSLTLFLHYSLLLSEDNFSSPKFSMVCVSTLSSKMIQAIRCTR